MESSWPRMAAGPEGGRLSYLVPKMELWVSVKFTRVHPWGSGQSCERRLQPLDLAVTLPGAEGQLGHSSLAGHSNKSARVWFFGFGSGFCLFVFHTSDGIQDKISVLALTHAVRRALGVRGTVVPGLADALPILMVCFKTGWEVRGQ